MLRVAVGSFLDFLILVTQAQSAKPSACHKTLVNRQYACADRPRLRAISIARRRGQSLEREVACTSIDSIFYGTSHEALCFLAL